MRLSNFFACLCLLLAGAAVCQAQFYTLPGSYGYSLNSVNEVFDVAPDGKLAVTLRNSPANAHAALLTSFNPLTGAPLDSETFGFGPLGVQLAQTSDGLRAVVLTSEGGPRTVYLFGVGADGQLTQLASTRLTNSGADAGSNVVLSAGAGVGFTLVAVANGSELVAFSLSDGSVVKRLNLASSAGNGNWMAMSETADGRRTLAFMRNNATLVLADASDPAQMALLGPVALPHTGSLPTPGLAFSSDGQLLFVSNSSASLSAVDVATRQVVGTLGGYVFSRALKIHESGPQRRLAVFGLGTGGNQSGVLLVDASNPAQMSVVGQRATNFQYKSDLAFSGDGSRLFVSIIDRIYALAVPSFTTDWEKLLPSKPTREQQIMTYGQPEEVLAAWEVSGPLNFVSMFGSFPASLPNVAVSDATVIEGDAAAFSITLSAATTHRVTVSYATADATALSPSDYSNVSASVVFEPGETLKTVSVQTVGDAIDESDEAFKLNLTGADVGVVTLAQGTANILDDDPPPLIFVNHPGLREGDAGTQSVSLAFTLSAPSVRPVTVNYATADGTAAAGSDYVAAGGTLTFNPGEVNKSVPVTINGDGVSEPDETIFVNLSAPTNATLASAQGVIVILNDDPKVQFAAGSLTATEGVDRSVTLNVTRAGDLSAPTSVSYETIPGTASDKSDFSAAYGTLRFAPNESTRSITIFITDDAFAEPAETFSVLLFGASGAGHGAPSTATVQIISNDPADGANPVRDATFDAQFFVRQHYHDFLNREPDAAGLAFWVNQITECEARPAAERQGCREIRRINVSAAFFLSIEFQETGYLAYRTYGAAFGTTRVGATLPLALREFLHDTQEISGGVVIGQPGAEALLEANKAAYFDRFVLRPPFPAVYPGSMTAAQFVDALNANASGPLSQTERDALVADLDARRKTRAQVLRSVAENATFRQRELNRAFVLMQYFGYLRRNPNDAPELNLDFSGYNFWLGKLNDHNGNFVSAEMVKAFITSGEYQQRFGP